MQVYAYIDKDVNRGIHTDIEIDMATDGDIVIHVDISTLVSIDTGRDMNAERCRYRHRYRHRYKT